MARYILLGFLPAALACANADTNSCASFIKSQSGTASAYCATFTKSTVTATTGLPAWATNCDNKPSQISKECSCYYTGGGGSSPTTTGGGSGGGSGTTPTGITTTLPKSSGAVATSKAITVSGSYDGGMKMYDRSRKLASTHKA